MLSEPMTLYKLMNLYMLKKVNFPLTNAQLIGLFPRSTNTPATSRSSRPLGN